MFTDFWCTGCIRNTVLFVFADIIGSLRPDEISRLLEENQSAGTDSDSQYCYD
jgi:hypothetical protein